MSQEKFARASALIQEAIDKKQDGPKTWQLLVEAEAAQERLSHALQLSQEARAKYPTDPDTRLQLALIYRVRGQTAEADAELNHLIDEFPKFEPGYKALIAGLISSGRTGGSLDGGLGGIVTVLARMNRELPDSKYAQVTSATIYARAGRLEESEAMLRRLLTEHPDDPDILVPLAQVRQLLGHTDDAIALLADALKNHPQVRIAEELVSLYKEQGKEGSAVELTMRLVKENPQSEAYAVLQASIPTANRKYDDAIAIMTAAAERFPRSQEITLALARLQDSANKPTDAIKTMQAFLKANGETPERLYALSHFYSAAENDDAAVAALQRILSLMPDHTGANNDLGYFWTDEGIHLGEAERMIKKAVDNEPNNSAYLDSLGWLYYKQGKFNDAISLLEKSIAEPNGMIADVVQHLGDALYRAGRKPEAFERWTQAASLLEGDGEPLSKSRLKLKDYLDHLKTAMRTGTTPVVSPIATEAKPQSAGPTSVPTTGPS